MTSTKKDLLFTYGSLMSTAEVDAGSTERRLLTTEAQLVGAASVPGLLFDVGPYPAAVLTRTGCETLYGEVWRLPRRRARLFAALDRYEGCGRGCEEPSPYVRIRTKVTLHTGVAITAWAYVWNRSVDGMKRFDGGRWPPAFRNVAPGQPGTGRGPRLDMAA